MSKTMQKKLVKLPQPPLHLWKVTILQQENKIQAKSLDLGFTKKLWVEYEIMLLSLTKGENSKLNLYTYLNF